MANNGEWFFVRQEDDVANKQYQFALVNKKTGVELARFFTKSKRFKDFNTKIEGGKLLTYNLNEGLDIIDLEGNVLYSIQDDSFNYIINAVMDDDKVYAAGIKWPEKEFDPVYLEILEWDYKNDTLRRKYFPCDSPDLEM